MNSTAILWHYINTKYLRKFRDREHLLTWQNQKVRQFIKQIIPKSSFYSHYYQNCDLRDWQNLPIINKAIMMANFDQLNLVGITQSEAFALACAAEKTRDFCATLQGCTVGLSSGTSGSKGLFLVSQREQQLWAGTILAKALPQPILTAQKIAFFLRANSNLYETVNNQRLQFQYFDLLAALTSHIERLNQYSPTILIAPPSMLRLLADSQRQGSLRISPAKIIAVAEVLEPLDETYISQVFGQIIHQIYQCTEGFLGVTCPYGTLHLNEDIVAIEKEYLDQERGRFLPIITDFNRTTQPIIRYRLDDILTEQKIPCPCGSVFTAIENIEGRCDDIFYLPSLTQEKFIPLFPDFIRRSIMTASEEILEYQAVQKSANLVEISLRVPPDKLLTVQQVVSQYLQATFEKAGCQVPEICYNELTEQRDRAVKLRRVKREFYIDSVSALN
jgi:putative adenylate-forming enzyme